MSTGFIETKEYRRFDEFCDACSQNRYVGICYGPPGVGKTLSARHYTNWDQAEAIGIGVGFSVTDGPPFTNRGVFYTVDVVTTPARIEREISTLRQSLQFSCPTFRELAERHDRERKTQDAFEKEQERLWEMGLRETRPTYAGEFDREFARQKRIARQESIRLIIVDEADRLKMQGLEQFRQIFDRGGIGLVLIGMPGLEKRLARYPQLYSRIGFAHQFRPLTPRETLQLLDERRLAADLQADDEGIAAILRVTGGNFRLLDRLLAQIRRILEINTLTTITRDVVEAARENLVIGTE
jgi:hypothetical protein